MMNKYAKIFIRRGAAFSGLGPVVAGIVLAAIPDVTLTGGQVLLAVVSTYLLAFVQAGATVFNQIEHWPLSKSLLCHFGSLYLAYSACYLVNSWIPFDPLVLLLFTAVFAAIYFTVWITVYLCVRAVGRRLNDRIE